MLNILVTLVIAGAVGAQATSRYGSAGSTKIICLIRLRLRNIHLINFLLNFSQGCDSCCCYSSLLFPLLLQMMAAAAAAKNDLLIKDELDPVADSAAVLSLKSEPASSAFKNSDNNGGDIKDEFTDEMEDAVVCGDDEGIANHHHTDDEEPNGDGGDQDTETDELNDAEEINDEMTMLDDEEEEEEVAGDAGMLLDEEDGQSDDHHQLLVHEDEVEAAGEEEEGDPLNDPLLGEEEGDGEAVPNGDAHEVDGGESSNAALSEDQKPASETDAVGDSAARGGGGGRRAGLKRKAADADVTAEEDKAGETATVRKSSRIRNLLDLRKEKEEALLQGTVPVAFIK
jgi:hypothetical protein